MGATDRRLVALSRASHLCEAMSPYTLLLRPSCFASTPRGPTRRPWPRPPPPAPGPSHGRPCGRSTVSRTSGWPPRSPACGSRTRWGWRRASTRTAAPSRPSPAWGWATWRSARSSARPSRGNPRPRLFRLPADEAIVVNYGVPNDGAAAVAARVAARPTPVPLGVNLVETNSGRPAAARRGDRPVRRGRPRLHRARRLPHPQPQLPEHDGRRQPLRRPRGRGRPCWPNSPPSTACRRSS